MTAPNPPEFPAGAEFRVSWQMPPASVVAYDYEDRFGEGVWLRLSAQQWAELPWAPHQSVGTDYDLALDQYRQLWKWAESHEQPIRNVRIEWRPPAQWTEIAGVAPAVPPNPAPHVTADWLGPVRTWCCGTPTSQPHEPDCAFRATSDNPIDYDGPAEGPTYGGRYA